MNKIKKYYSFWLGLLIFLVLNSIESIRQDASTGMMIMYLVGYILK